MQVKFIKDLSLHGTNSINILNNIILGSNDIRPYNTTITYNIGSLVLYYDTSINQYTVMKCNSTGVTGVYNSAKWDVFNPLISSSTGGIDCGTF
jgi:hypothetical protein